MTHMDTGLYCDFHFLVIFENQLCFILVYGVHLQTLGLRCTGHIFMLLSTEEQQEDSV